MVPRPGRCVSDRFELADARDEQIDEAGEGVLEIVGVRVPVTRLEVGKAVKRAP